MKSKVAIVKVKPDAKQKQIQTAVNEMMEMLNGVKGLVTKGDAVLVKPNFGTQLRKLSVNPRIALATLRWFSQIDCETFIGEDPVIMISESRIYKRWKLKEMAKKSNAKVVSLRHGPHSQYKVPKPLFFKKIEISTAAKKADLVVSLAKMKTVNVCYVSLSLKNMKGLITPEWKRRFHCEGLEKGIVDLNQVVKPKLAIIDGTYACDSVSWKEKPVGIIVGSNDCVAADAVCTRIMGLNPHDVDHITWAEKVGLGTANDKKIEILGESLDKLIGKFRFSKPINPFDVVKKYRERIQIIQGNPCSACVNELGNELRAVKEKLKKIKGLVILVGPRAKISDRKKTIVLYGNCLERYKTEGIFIHGCPPGFQPSGVGSIRKVLKEIENRGRRLTL